MMSAAEVAAALDLFEVAPCGYLFTRPDGTLTRANLTFLQWTGYTAQDLLDRKRFQELLTRPAAIFYETHFAPLLRMQGFVREITVDFVCSDGSIFPALVNSNIHCNSSGEPLLVLTTIFDVRERRRYERELLVERRRAEQLALVVANAAEAVMTIDSKGNLTSWNRGAESVFGYRAAEAIGRQFSELMVQQIDNERFKRIVLTLRSGKSMQQDMILRHKNGELIDAAVSLTPNREPVDDYAGFSAIVSDLQARRKVEKAQQMARDLELINQLAHEINNPLQAIVNCMSLAATTGSDKYVHYVEENLSRIANVITRLVDITRK
jgi:PAS domain S-box-containing protein